LNVILVATRINREVNVREWKAKMFYMFNYSIAIRTFSHLPIVIEALRRAKQISPVIGQI